MSTTSSRAAKPCLHGAARFRGGWLCALLCLLLAPMAGLVVPGPSPALANHTNIKMPFASGANWRISQGYNGSSHQNNSSTWQYYYSFDLVRSDGNTAGQRVISPVNGTIRWIDESYGGMSINLGDGYAFAYFHTYLAPGLAAGQTITQGQYLGTIAGPGDGGNGGFPHIHINLWTTNDGGNWDRHAVPFTGDHKLDGYDFPDKGGTYQYNDTTVVSTNVEGGGGGGGNAPATPSQVSPPTGTTYTTSPKTTTLSWSSVATADEYQVVVNDGAYSSGWQTGTSWTTPSLGNGQYRWQVRARNGNGTSSLSASWVFWIDPGGSTNPTPTPTVAPGSLALGLSATSGRVGSSVTATGTGYDANEAIRLYIDTVSSANQIATTKASASGTWSLPVTVPNRPGGNHTIIGRGMTSDKRATKTFKINSYLDRTPYQGPPGTMIDLTVTGFGSNETVKVNFDSQSGKSLATITTDATGTGAAMFDLPEASTGWHDYVGVGQTSGLTAWGALYIEDILSVNPTSGAPGANIQVTAKGFPASQGITIAWNKTSSSAGTNVCNGTTTSAGNYNCSFAIPSQALAGQYPVVGTSTNGTTSSVNVTVTGAAAVSVTPTSGAVSSSLNVSAGGFGANETINFTWDNSTSVWQARSAGSGGAVQFTGLVPNLTVGSHTLKAKGVTSGKSASTSFSITAGSSGNTSMIGLGTYAVTATEEGLVGGTTSNGHVIQNGDRFVSLPACTDSSCPGYTSGGYRAACGSNCYVRVTNPDNDECSVGPVWDVGPWFTNDNWWDPTDQRNLNKLATTKNILPQGYVGTDAARDGLDVGYGVTSRGIGISNVGYEVGNRAAIDLGDGTWTDIGFARNDGIGDVIVTLLWQTGEDHTAAANACGQGGGSTPTPTKTPTKTPTGTVTATKTPSATPTATGTVTTARSLTLSPGSGPIHTVVTVNGTGLRGGEKVNFYFGSKSGTAVKSVTVSGNGTFTTSIEIPEREYGYILIAAKGQTSGLTASRSFKVLPELTTDPAQSKEGSSVDVDVSGFKAGESAELHWDTSGGAVLATISTNSKGIGTGTFVIPPGASGGNHSFVGIGLTSGATGTGTVGVISLRTASVTVSPTSGAPRNSITVAGSHLGANETVDAFWDSSTTSAGNAKANASGAVNLGLEVPLTPAGSHTIKLKGRTSGIYNSASFNVIPSLDLSPTVGPVGTSLSIKGRGWAVSSSVTVYWNRTPTRTGSQLCVATTSSTGSFSCAGTVPNNAVATYPVVGVAGSLTASASFRINGASAASVESASPTAEPAKVTKGLSLSPTNGPAGTEVTLNGGGFTPDEKVDIYLRSTTSKPVANVTADKSGAIAAKLTVPDEPAGYLLIVAKGEKSGTKFSKSFKITDGSGATPTPGQGTPTPTGESGTATEDTSQTPVATESETTAPTDVPTEIPTEVPTEEPPPPTETPAPVQRDLVLYPVADTSVSAATPEASQPGDSAGGLNAGGPEGAVALITFQIEGIGAGTVVSGQLILTDVGESGAAGGTIGFVPGYWVDEGNLTYAGAPINGVPAAAAGDGSAANAPWFDPWVETAIDVTGAVGADGVITFVITGSPDATLALGSRESNASPRLQITVLDPPG